MQQLSTKEENYHPKRVISLLGAATETLFRLGVGDRLVGRSHECDYPPIIVNSIQCFSRPRIDVNASSIQIDQCVRDITITGESVYVLDDKLITEIQPDLIITQDHCNVCAVTPNDVTTQSSQCTNIPQLILRPQTLQDCIDDIAKIANAMGVHDRGQRLQRSMLNRIQNIKDIVQEVSTNNENNNNNNNNKPSVAVLEWCNPIMGCGYWIPELINIAGGNALHSNTNNTPTISYHDLIQSKPDVIIFALCGFKIERAIKEIYSSWTTEQLIEINNICNGNVYIMDGNGLINRSGPRLVESCEALAEAIHTDLQGHFGHYGTTYLIPFVQSDKHIGSAKVKEKTNCKDNRSDNITEITSVASSSNINVQVIMQPKEKPSETVSIQLEMLRNDNFINAFSMNSIANQNRWGTAAMFKHVLKCHDTFRRLLSEIPESVIDETINENGMTASVKVLLAKDKDGKQASLRWCLLSESKSDQSESVWRTEKVEFA